MGWEERVGIGLWTFQSTAAAPSRHRALYEAFAADSCVVERHGLHSAWVAEHHFWYDGWCPAPLHALAFAAARTRRLRLGTAMLLLPQHDPAAIGEAVTTLDRLSGGRLELGVGLGYRDEEFDAVGIRRDRRGRRMDASLEALGPRAATAWIGGMSVPAIERAAAFGARMMLPQTVSPEQLESIAARCRELTAERRPVGAMRDVHVVDDPRRARRFSAELQRAYREEAGSWWILDGERGFRRPDLLERQLEHTRGAALIGSASHVADGLSALAAAGATHLLLRLQFAFVDRETLHEQIARVAHEVVPRIAATNALALSGAP